MAKDITAWILQDKKPMSSRFLLRPHPVIFPWWWGCAASARCCMKQKQPIKQNPRPLPSSLFVPRSCLSFPTMALHQQPLHCNGCLLKASFLSTSHSSSSDRQSSKFPLRSDSIWSYLETKRMRVIKCHVYIFLRTAPILQSSRYINVRNYKWIELPFI